MHATQRTRLGRRAAAALSIASVTLIAVNVHADDVFTDLEYDEAFTQAVEQEKIFFVHGTAVWCGPCRMMEQNTYPDETLADWMAEHVVAYKLDVDDEPDRAAELGIRAMPTMIFFVAGEEYGRVTGYRGPGQLLDVFETVEEGGEMPASPQMEQSRTQQALAEAQQALRGAQRPEDAGDLIVELWEAVPDMARGERQMVRQQLPLLTESLVEMSRDWRPRIASLRDAAKDRLDRPALRQWEDLVTWVQLNHALDEDEVTFAWFDRVKEKEAALPTIRRLDDTLREVLIANNRWADLYVTYSDPERTIQSRLDALDIMAPRIERALESSGYDGEELADVVADMMRSERQEVVATASRMYAACLAAGHDETGKRVVDMLLEQIDAGEVLPEVLDTAIQAAEVREHQMQWLDEAGAFDGHAQLRERVKMMMSAMRTGD